MFRFRPRLTKGSGGVSFRCPLTESEVVRSPRFGADWLDYEIDYTHIVEADGPGCAAPS